MRLGAANLIDGRFVCSCTIATGTEETTDYDWQTETEEMINLSNGYCGNYTGQEFKVLLE